MAYDEEQKRSRVVVETPTARREVVRTETSHVPDRQGFSTGAVAALVVGAVALVTILFLFLMKNQDDTTNANVRVTQPPVTAQQPQQQPVIVQQPAQQQPPIIVQQPATSQPAPVIVQQPATNSGSTQPSGTDDLSVQSSVDRKISDDTTLAALGVTAIVLDGKVTLTGTVDSEAMKSRVERVVKSVKGVRGVDNKIIVSST
jgi:uncharacterized protein HemX